MPYLIDGNNLIGHMPNLELDDPGSKRRLVEQLAIFQAAKKTKVILVFDGPMDPDLFGDQVRKKKFTILWPNMDENADSIIKKQVRKQTDLRRFYVVSNDREIQTFARKKRAKTIDCKEFQKRLRKALKEYRESRSMNKTDIVLTSLELDHWMDIFGSSDE